MPSACSMLITVAKEVFINDLHSVAGRGEHSLSNSDDLLLGYITDLYSVRLAATSEGSIPMNDGEELLIIEHDQGDGWTRVRRQNDLEEGFVPTSYIECTVISNC
ncbi:Formin-binding protein 1 [Homalodisca vitripennis]|nr:Formin-binding protein 1 [Homalodisca vitripennis]